MDYRSWRRLSEALDYYRARGFDEISLPWTVARPTAMITCPAEARLYPLGDEVLVGSAEQSFIAAQLAGRLGTGRFVALTPCFRNEGNGFDDLHQSGFMKVELYSTIEGRQYEDMLLAYQALDFMRTQAGDLAPRIGVVETDEGYDLEIAGVELGSYSSRSHAGISWTCGTGLAEPRFSKALQIAAGYR